MDAIRYDTAVVTAAASALTDFARSPSRDGARIDALVSGMSPLEYCGAWHTVFEDLERSIQADFAMMRERKHDGAHHPVSGATGDYRADLAGD